MINEKGYSFPDPIDPGEVACFKVYVPKDTLYLAAFWRAYQFFGEWLAWRRDDAHTGKDVAALWRPLIELARSEYEASGGVCSDMAYQLRQNPANPCQLQQSLDGGVTWSLAFDYSLCANVISVPAPYPGSSTGASDAAAAAIKNVFQGLLDMLDCVTMTREQYITAATAYLRNFDASYANPAALGAIYDEFCALDSSQQDFYKSDCPYLGHKSDLQNCTSPDGLMEWLNCASDAIQNWLNDTSDSLMNALNQAANALSGNGWQNAAAGGDGGGAGFGGACDWIADLDLTANEGGWTIDIECAQPDGHYTAGVGLVSDDGYTGGGCATPKNRLSTRMAFSTTTAITRVIAYRSPGAPSDGWENWIGGIVGTDHNLYTIFTVNDGAGTPIDTTLPPGYVGEAWVLGIDHHDGIVGVSAAYTRLKIYGTGAIPVELAPYII